MEWTRTDTIALALDTCAYCRGLGLKTGPRGTASPCNCVLRNIFRACYARFRECERGEKNLTRCTLEFTPGRDRRLAWSRKDEEFCADFYLVSKRTLDAEEFRIFRFHYLLGADWRLCCRKLNMDRGSFFHTAYRIERKLGRAFRELRPYGLYPLSVYFSPGTSGERAMASLESRVIPIRPPVRAGRGEPVPAEQAA